MALLEQPWARVKQPTVLPPALDRDLVAGLQDDQLAEVLRDHLVPSGGAGAERAVWDRFWAVLSADDDLAERAFEVLEDFLDQVEDALEAASAEHPQRKRMTKFQLNAENAIARLDREPTVRGTRGVGRGQPGVDRAAVTTAVRAEALRRARAEVRVEHSRRNMEGAAAQRDARSLGAAIAAHRDTTENSGRGFTLADIELWDVLDRVEDARVATQAREKDRR